MRITAVYVCVRVLAEAFASLPRPVYLLSVSGGKDKADGHPLYVLLHNEPNPERTSFVFRDTLMTHLLLWGNAYVEVARNSSTEVFSLTPMPLDSVSVYRDPASKLCYCYYVGSLQRDSCPTMSCTSLGVALMVSSDIHRSSLPEMPLLQDLLEGSMVQSFRKRCSARRSFRASRYD